MINLDANKIVLIIQATVYLLASLLFTIIFFWVLADLFAPESIQEENYFEVTIIKLLAVVVSASFIIALWFGAIQKLRRVFTKDKKTKQNN